MKKCGLILVLLLMSYRYYAGFVLHSNKPLAIHFQLINNLIFIPIEVNGVKLTFLLDSGVTETILFSLDDKSIDIQQYEKLTFSGLGNMTEIEGIKAEKLTFKIAPEFIDTSHYMYIILDEDFNLSNHVGIPVNGIIGYHFFKNNTIGINFIKNELTVFPNQHKRLEKMKKKYQSIPLELVKNKPHVNASIYINKSVKEGKFLIDLGNNDAVWLFSNRMPKFSLTQTNYNDVLGRGFNGDILGVRSRIKYFQMGAFTLNLPTIAVPDTNSIASLQMAKGRIGSIGSEILSRFHLIFDYPNSMLYCRKNNYYTHPFLINMSGLEVVQNGSEWSKEKVKLKVDLPYNVKEENGTSVYNPESRFSYSMKLLPVYEVASVRKKSPADEAGMIEGDKIIRINLHNAKHLSLQNIYNLLGAKDGKKVEIVFMRNDIEMRKTIILKDPIPFVEE